MRREEISLDFGINSQSPWDENLDQVFLIRLKANETCITASELQAAIWQNHLFGSQVYIHFFFYD